LKLQKRMESSLSLPNWNCKKNGNFPLSTKLKLQKEWELPSLPNWNCKKEWKLPSLPNWSWINKTKHTGFKALHFFIRCLRRYSKLSKENDKWGQLISFQYVLFQFFSHCEIGGESFFSKLFPVWNRRRIIL
jgi:hypothetical protein